MKAFIPPYYETTWSLPMKYGGIGSIIAHEITHGFDSKTTIQWDGEDLELFAERKGCLVEQYDKYGRFNDSLKVCSKLTHYFNYDQYFQLGSGILPLPSCTMFIAKK